MGESGESRIMRKRNIAIAIGILLLILGAALAWFFNERGIATMTRVRGPGVISIDGTHGNSMAILDMSYDAKNVSDDKKVTVQNVICVGSDSDTCEFEIAHTTNINGLVLNIYPAGETLNEAEAGSDYISRISKGKTYYYSYNSNKGYSTSAGSNGLEQLKCLNKASGEKIAETAGRYHDETYGSDDRVQKNAEPLYWTLNNDTLQLKTRDKAFAGGKSNYYEYAHFYVVEAIWTETAKETDLVYVMVNSPNVTS